MKVSKKQMKKFQIIFRANSRRDTVGKRIYNRVMDDRSAVCPLGELLTDKELERMRLYAFRRDWPNTVKVTVKTGEIYFCFGVRFAESYELVKQENSNGK